MAIVLRLSLGVALALSAVTASAQTRYRVVELQHLNATYGMNAQRDVAGLTYDAIGNTFPAVVKDGSLIPLPGLQSRGFGRALALNDRGEVVGDAMTPLPAPHPGAVSHAFYWSAATGTIDLTPGSQGASWAYAINNRGEIAGELMQGENSGPFVWRVKADGTVEAERIGVAESTSNAAYDINDNGVVAGSHWDYAWVYDSTSDRLEPLPHGTRSVAYGINERGDVVGRVPSVGKSAALWEKTASGYELHAIGFLPEPYLNCYGQELNDSWTVIGECVAPRGVPNTAFIWQQGRMYKADELLVERDAAEYEIRALWDITEDGVMLGTAIRRSDGKAARVMLLPEGRRRPVKR